MIKLVNVTKEFNLDEQVITPVRDVNLEVSKGEFVIIIGRSGTGKSTMLNLVAGLIRPTTGSVLVEGRDLAQLSDKEMSRLRSREMGYVFQFPSLLPALTIRDNIAMPSTFSADENRKGSPKRAEDLLEMLGLGERMDCYPRHLSAGEQKRAVIARSLMNEPRILLADEPTSDLDERTEKEIMALLKQIHDSGVTILMVTHSLGLVPYATRAYSMGKGKLELTHQK
ncbi:MAG: ABC transporter ATP-binding protein [Dehalococcoidia bacterium]|nr:MAG: ABC transporter ATP-binding protein [Dehalococcoidia bacterium]